MRNEKRVNFGKRKALVFMALFAVFVSLSIGTASAATHSVHPGESIQDAIDAANASDTIEVYSGTYYENVNVTKQLVLRGVDTDTGKPIVDASGNGSAIILSADGCVLEGFEVAGIKVISNGNFIKDNKVISNNWYGIDLHESCNNSIEDNNVSSNGEGIKLYKSTNNTVIDNKASTINGTGIGIWLSMNNTITGNNASNNSVGIKLLFSSNNTITGNIGNYNKFYGILIAESSENTITGNTVSYNTYGIYPVYPSSRKTYNPRTGETNFSNNEHNGIDLSNSGNNKIYLNNFINNRENVHPEISGNFWNSTEPLTYQYKNTTFTSYMGNFWSDYKGPDADGNGLGDTPYVIDSDEDRHPLMSRFENYLDICAKVWH